MTQPDTALNEDFKKWADIYVVRMYPFYTRETAISVASPLYSQLKSAWDAGIESSYRDLKAKIRGMRKEAPQFDYDYCLNEPIEVEEDRHSYNRALDDVLKMMGE